MISVVDNVTEPHDVTYLFHQHQKGIADIHMCRIMENLHQVVPVADETR